MDLKRTLLRTNRYAATLQAQTLRTRGRGRNVRSPEGRNLIASNMIYRRRYA